MLKFRDEVTLDLLNKLTFVCGCAFQNMPKPVKVVGRKIVFKGVRTVVLDCQGSLRIHEKDEMFSMNYSPDKIKQLVEEVDEDATT